MGQSAVHLETTLASAAQQLGHRERSADHCSAISIKVVECQVQAGERVVGLCWNCASTPGRQRQHASTPAPARQHASTPGRKHASTPGRQHASAHSHLQHVADDRSDGSAKLVEWQEQAGQRAVHLRSAAVNQARATALPALSISPIMAMPSAPIEFEPRSILLSERFTYSPINTATQHIKLLNLQCLTDHSYAHGAKVGTAQIDACQRAVHLQQSDCASSQDFCRHLQCLANDCDALIAEVIVVHVDDGQSAVRLFRCARNQASGRHLEHITDRGCAISEDIVEAQVKTGQRAVQLQSMIVRVHKCRP